MREKRWVMGKPLDYPELEEEIEENCHKFFKRIKQIVKKENHIFKWKDVCYALCILEMSAKNVGLNIGFAYSHGQWMLYGFENKDDYLRLPEVAKEFGRIYRHDKHDCKECTDREKELFELGESVWEQKMKMKK